VVGVEAWRVARIEVPERTKRDRRSGSGYLIRPERVLTAAHVMAETSDDVHIGSSCDVTVDGQWVSGSLVWCDWALDLALLHVSGVGIGRQSVPFGRLEGGVPLRWTACGYPRASATGGTWVEEQASGDVPPASGRSVNRLELTVTSRNPVAISDHSPWFGFSGAAVLVEDHVVGVILADPRSYATSLQAVRIEVVERIAAFAQALGTAFGVHSIGQDWVPEKLPQLLEGEDPLFTGRQADLDGLASTGAEADATTVISQALVGLGGIGKTALAREFANQSLKRGDVDLALWFVASNRQSLMTNMADASKRLLGVQAAGDVVEHGAWQLRDWLERPGSPRWLVVFDNADDPDDLAGLIPSSTNGRVLITSRVTDWPGVTVRRLDVLSTEDGTALMKRLSESTEPEDEARPLVDALGGLALAIKTAAGRIRKTGETFRAYLSVVRTLADDPELSDPVTAVWRTSIDLLHKRGRAGELAIAVFGILAYLDAERIPVDVVRPGHGNLLGAADQPAITMAIGSLVDCSLLTKDRDTLSVHRLMQQVTRTELDRGGTKRRSADTAFRLVRSALMRHGATPDDVLGLLPHLSVTADHLRRVDGEARRVCRSWRRVNFAVRAARLRARSQRLTTLAVRGPSPWLVSSISAMLADQARVLGNQHRDVLTTRRALLKLLGAEADAAFARLADEQASALGPTDRSTLHTLRDLAVRIGQRGNPGEAARRLEEVLAAQRQLMAETYFDVVETRSSLAFWLGEAHRYEDAIELLKPLIVDLERGRGRWDRATLRAHHNLATYLVMTGRRDDGIARLEQCLEVEARVFGPDDPLTTTTRQNLTSFRQHRLPVLRVDPTALNFGSVLRHRRVGSLVTVANIGSGDLEWTHAITSGSDFITAERRDDHHLQVALGRQLGAHRGTIRVSSAGGDAVIDVAATIRRSWVWRQFPRATVAAVVIAVIAVLAVIFKERGDATVDAVVGEAVRSGWVELGDNADSPTVTPYCFTGSVSVETSRHLQREDVEAEAVVVRVRVSDQVDTPLGCRVIVPVLSSVMDELVQSNANGTSQVHLACWGDETACTTLLKRAVEVAYASS
jgi:hypothetical protein